MNLKQMIGTGIVIAGLAGALHFGRQSMQNYEAYTRLSKEYKSMAEKYGIEDQDEIDMSDLGGAGREYLVSQIPYVGSILAAFGGAGLILYDKHLKGIFERTKKLTEKTED